MRKFLFILLPIIVLMLFLFYFKSDYPKATPTIYFNANIITINDQFPKAEAMLVVDGKIASIGTSEEILSTASKRITKIDLKGATVLPGFIDVHTHFALSMFMEEMHDLSGFKHDNNEAVWNHFEAVVDNSSENDWVICKGIDPILVRDLQTPTIQYLDSIAPKNAVILFSQSLHSYWGNSLAFEKAGITQDTKNPSSHSYYERDSKGNFTGLIVEQEALKPFSEFIRSEILTPKVLSEASVKVMRKYAGNGNTTIVSTGLTIQDSKPLILTEHLSAQTPTLLGGLLEKIGQLPQREPLPRHFIYMRHDTPHLLPEARGEQNDFYGIIGVKHWYDGSPYIGSMYMAEPYVDSDLTTDKLDIPQNSKGNALVDQNTLKAFIKEKHTQGWQIAIHSQGDAAIEEVVNAYKELDSELDFSQSRHRLEHCLMLPLSTLNDLKQLNLTPSFHINHLYYYGEALYTDMLGEERADSLLPVNSAIQNDLIVSLHADQPMFESNPFHLIQTAVERKTKAGRSLGEGERIERMQAIKALTINAAWQIYMENKVGSLETGKFADFIILDQNPLEVPIEEMHKIKCVETFVNGNRISIEN